MVEVVVMSIVEHESSAPYREPLDVLIWLSVNSSRSTSLHSIADRITESTLSLIVPDGP